jgi:hypothetical protein
VESFRDGTFIYPRHVLKGAAVGSITFMRAASLYDSDFYDWIYLAIHGQTQDGSIRDVRRTLVILQFGRQNASKLDDTRDILTATSFFSGLAGAAVAGGLGPVAATIGATGLAGVGLNALSSALGLALGPFSYAARIPARAWILHNCIPVGYVSNSDFDASNAEISLMQLEVQPEYVEELSMGKGGLVGGLVTGGLNAAISAF